MKKKILNLFIVIILIIGCKERFSPKPKGYLRIDLEEKSQILFKPSECYFSFYAPNYFKLMNKKKCWIDLEYPKHNATIYITYKKIDNNLFQLLEDSRNMVYKHTVKADAINEKIYLNKVNQTYGPLYDISGETASAIQFHITDSIHHFIRGSLYFDVHPNQDSLKPIINHLRNDITQIMETLQWEEIIALKE